jgi:uncharacterized coiled-coil protein SlyX
MNATAIRADEASNAFHRLNQLRASIDQTEGEFADLTQRLQIDVAERDQRIDQLKTTFAAREKIIAEKDARIVAFQKECLRLHDLIAALDLQVYNLREELSASRSSRPSVDFQSAESASSADSSSLSASVPSVVKSS